MTGIEVKGNRLLAIDRHNGVRVEIDITGIYYFLKDMFKRYPELIKEEK